MVRIIPSPRIIPAAGYPPKNISEYVGRVVSGSEEVSIAMMKSPPGWNEPGQIPEFNEYSIVLSGFLYITTRAGEYTVSAGQAVLAPAGEWIQYSSPEGAEYIAVCLPAFSPDLVHRDGEMPVSVREKKPGTLQIIYKDSGSDGLSGIETLWNQLSEHHVSRARNFAEIIKGRAFAERCQEILSTGTDLLVQTAYQGSEERPVGFCISSVKPAGGGEIDSIFVEPQFRSLGIGSTFMDHACTWMREKGITEIGVNVCEGNEEMFRFYQRFGFSLRRHYLLNMRDR
jgi:GNAT superfamily N-acetyltransferase/quercetin dioxygenase-like cupin family protein